MRVFAFVGLFAATPAFAHHEVVAAVSLAPLAWGFAAVTIAGLAGWRRRVLRHKR